MKYRSLLVPAVMLAVLLQPLSNATAAASFTTPRLSGPVVDNGQFLSSNTKHKIETALREIKRQGGGTEIAVLTVPDLGGLTIEQASIQVVDEWKLGSAEKDNGVLLFFSKKERRMRIEVGQGLEGSLTDAHAKRIIDETITPLFRANEVDNGILLGVYEIAKRTNPELNVDQIFGSLPAAKRSSSRRGSGGKSLGSLILMVIFLLIIFGGRGRGGRGLLAGLFLGSMMGGGRGGYYGGGGGGGFGGGGFGGGGGFSGGGASGGW